MFLCVFTAILRRASFHCDSLQRTIAIIMMNWLFLTIFLLVGVFVVASVEEEGSRRSAFEVSPLNDVDDCNVGEVALFNVTDYSHITIKFGIPSGSFGVAIGGERGGGGGGQGGGGNNGDVCPHCAELVSLLDNWIVWNRDEPDLQSFKRIQVEQSRIGFFFCLSFVLHY